MEKSSEQNFLSVRTRVTVSDAHSVVRMKTALMQMYWVKVLSARYTSMLGACKERDIRYFRLKVKTWIRPSFL